MFSIFQNLPIAYRLAISASLISLLVISLFTFVWRAHHQFDQQAQAALEFGDAVLHIESVIRGANEAMSGGWGNTALESIDQERATLTTFFDQVASGRYQRLLHGDELSEIGLARQKWQDSGSTLARFVEVDEGATLEDLEESNLQLLLETGRMLETLSEVRNRLQLLSKDQYREVKEESALFQNLIIAGFLLLLLLSLAIFFGIYRLTSPPLQRLEKLMLEIKQSGDLSLRLSVESHDEVGRSATAINHLLEMMQAAVNEAGSVIEAIAEGTFDQRVTAPLDGDLEQLKRH